MNSIKYPWSNTFNEAGYPFECIDDPDRIPAGYFEKADIIAIISDSEGLGLCLKDSFTFLYDAAQEEDAEWSVLISVPDSFTHSGANAFIMARETTSPSSPYFAVVRPASFLPLSVLIRKQENGLPIITPALNAAPGGIPWHDVPFVRLGVSDGSRTFIAYGSFNGSDWSEIARHTFTTPLPLQGIGASSDIPGNFKALFADLERTSDEGVKNFKVSDLIMKNIGSVRSASASDGVF